MEAGSATNNIPLTGEKRERQIEECKERIKFARNLLTIYNNTLQTFNSRSGVPEDMIQFTKLNRLKASHTIKMNEELISNGVLKPETIRLNEEILAKLLSHPHYRKI